MAEEITLPPFAGIASDKTYWNLCRKIYANPYFNQIICGINQAIEAAIEKGVFSVHYSLLDLDWKWTSEDFLEGTVISRAFFDSEIRKFYERRNYRFSKQAAAYSVEWNQVKMAS